MNQTYLKLKIDGIFPQDLRAGELGQIFTSLEELILEIVKINNPTITKEVLGVGVFRLESNSTDIDVLSKAPDLAEPAYFTITSILNEENFLAWPNRTLDPLREIQRIIGSYEKDAQFLVHNGKVQQSASLKWNTNIPKHEKIHTQSTLFGKVIRVGGSEPAVAIERSEDDKVYCSVQSEALAKELGNHLYEWVGVIGRSTLNPDDLSIENFHVEQVTEYEGNLSITETFDQLRGLVGKYFNDIENVDRFVKDLRS